MLQNKVFINAFDAVCAVSDSPEGIFDAICQHQTGIELYELPLSRKVIALGKIKKDFLLEEILQKTCQNVLEKSSLDNFKNTLLVIGSSVGGMQRTEKIFLADENYSKIDPLQHNINSIAHILNKHFVFKDDISFSTACTSSANALGYGYEIISKGIYDTVLVVGFDTLSQTTIQGFDALGVLASSPCRPFDTQRSGMNVSEGIAVLLLQNTCNKEGIELVSVGYSSDAHHMAHPSPDGAGALSAMKKALKSGKIAPPQVDYINAHGTGTIANDSSESNAIATLFGNKPYISSTKSITGHTLGAAGALEAIICILALQKQILPPNTYLIEAENKELNYVYEPKVHTINYALSNSLAFGGNNTSLLFRLPPCK